MGQHGKIKKIQMGFFGVHEIAIYGAPCAFLRAFTERMQLAHPDIALMYVDESHDTTANSGLQGWTKEGDGARLTHAGPIQALQQTLLRQADLVVVNGNHFAAQEQIIIYHPEKESGLQKRRTQLTHVRAFVGPRADYERLQAEGFALTESRYFEHPDHEEFIAWWRSLSPIAPVRPLVLTGGKSSRMGQDKSLMTYAGEAQYRRVFRLFDQLAMPPYLSCRAEQIENYEWPQDHIIMDRIMEIGPLAGLISAWMNEPESAWLTVACDMPHWGSESITQLLEARRPDAFATTLCIGPAGAPEPMATIWEPRAYPAVMQAISAGTTCPRKILQNHHIVRVEALYPEQLTNANTPEEWKQL